MQKHCKRRVTQKSPEIGPSPKGPQGFCPIAALLLTHIATAMLLRRALLCVKIPAAGLTPHFETSSEFSSAA